MQTHLATARHSIFGALVRGSETTAQPLPCVYRLRRWPQLDEVLRIAPVLRALSRMSAGPVTHAWFLAHCGLKPADAGELLDELVAAGCATRTDLSGPADRKEIQ